MTKTPRIDIKIILALERAQLTKQYGSYGDIIIQTKENQPAIIPAEYHEFIDVFETKNVVKLLDHGPHDLNINLKLGTTVFSSRQYPASPDVRETLNKYVDENLPKYFIRPSSYRAGAPVLFVWKMNGELCLYVDYRGQNNISEKDKYSLPLIEEILDNL